jgi:hypothetical protein
MSWTVQLVQLFDRQSGQRQRGIARHLIGAECELLDEAHPAIVESPGREKHEVGCRRPRDCSESDPSDGPRPAHRRGASKIPTAEQQPAAEYEKDQEVEQRQR